MSIIIYDFHKGEWVQIFEIGLLVGRLVVLATGVTVDGPAVGLRVFGRREGRDVGFLVGDTVGD